MIVMFALCNVFQAEKGLPNVGRSVNLLESWVEKTGTFLPVDRNVPVFVKVDAKLRRISKTGK